jgi:RecA/RadA recombinase
MIKPIKKSTIPDDEAYDLWKAFNKELDKESDFGGTMDSNTFAEIDDFYSTGSYNLNVRMTGNIWGGIPTNRITCLAGEPSCGKTFLLLNIYREAQKKGAFIIHYDSENDITKAKLIQFGIDPQKFRLEPVGTIQEFKNSIIKTVMSLAETKKAGKPIPKIVFGLDSAGNLASNKELEDALKDVDKVDFTRAKILRSVFRILTNKLAYIKCPMIFINHVYSDPGAFGDPTKMGGGKGLEYAASNILFLYKSQLKEGTTKNGIIVKVKPYKSRFVVPTEAVCHIRWASGMNPYVGLETELDWESVGIQRGKLELDKSGEIKSFEAKETSRYYAVKHLKENVPLAQLYTHKVFTDEILEKIGNKIYNKIKYSDSYTEDLEELVNFQDELDEIEDE